jgi:hypothetical protein
MADRQRGEAWTDQVSVESTRTLLLDGRLLDPPEGIRPVLRRVPSESRAADLPTAAAKEGHR